MLVTFLRWFLDICPPTHMIFGTDSWPFIEPKIMRRRTFHLKKRGKHLETHCTCGKFYKWPFDITFLYFKLMIGLLFHQFNTYKFYAKRPCGKLSTCIPLWVNFGPCNDKGNVLCLYYLCPTMWHILSCAKLIKISLGFLQKIKNLQKNGKN